MDCPQKDERRSMVRDIMEELQASSTCPHLAVMIRVDRRRGQEWSFYCPVNDDGFDAHSRDEFMKGLENRCSGCAR